MTPDQRATNQSLHDVLERAAAETAALEVGAVQALLPALAQARNELNRDLAAWINAQKGDDRYTPQAYRQSLLAIEASMGTGQSLLRDGVAGMLASQDARLRALANTHAARELRAFSTAGSIDLNPSVPVKIASTLISGRQAPMARYETSAARYAGQVGTDIRRELAVSVLRGDSLDQMVARLQRLGGPAGTVAVRGIAGTVGSVTEVIPEGLFRRYAYWAERLARTELAHAYTEQMQDIRHELLSDFPDMVRRWDASADRATCARCSLMHGTTSDPKTDKFPGDVDVPLHPNCRCRAGLWRPSWAQHLPTVAVQNGPELPPAPVPAPESWGRRGLQPEGLPPGLQNQILAAGEARTARAVAAQAKAAAQVRAEAAAAKKALAAEASAQAATELAASLTSLAESIAAQLIQEEAAAAALAKKQAAHAKKLAAQKLARQKKAAAKKAAAEAAKKAAEEAAKKAAAEAAALAAKKAAEEAAKKAAAEAAKKAAEEAAKKAAAEAAAKAAARAAAAASPLGGLSPLELLETKEGAARGSNEGGFYRGSDGVLRYVKRYSDPAQAHCEHLANNIYRDLGLGAPRSGVFEHAGATYYASVIEEVEAVSATLPVVEAQQVLGGLVADVITGNWDAVGLTFDNIVRLRSGTVIRIDNGGTFLFRAKAGRKATGLLGKISELDGFFDPSINPSYSTLARRAGYANVEAMRDAFIAQVRELTALRNRAGGWERYVLQHAAGMPEVDRRAVVKMLQDRHALLEQRVAAMTAPRPAVSGPLPRRTDIAGWRAPPVQGVAPGSGRSIAALPEAPAPPPPPSGNRLPSGESKAAFDARAEAAWRAAGPDQRGVVEFTGNNFAAIRAEEARMAAGTAARSAEMAKYSNEATRALNSITVEANHTGWRGIAGLSQSTVDAFINAVDPIGMNLGMVGGTTSFSWDTQVASSFMGGFRDSYRPDEYKILFQMDGKNVRPVEPISRNRGEHELVTSRTSQFRVLSVARMAGTQRVLIVELEEVF